MIMIQFETPQNLNGEQLINELIASGVTISEPPELDGNNNLWLKIKATDKTKAQAVVDAHQGIDTVKVLSIEDKLKKVDLTLDDLKAALGL
jgi:hypothetical protein